MDNDPAGRKALAAFGAVRFIPCTQAQYRVIYCMIEHIGAGWDKIGIDGPPPRRPAWLVHNKDDQCCDANS